MKYALWMAALYHVAFGTWAVLFPQAMCQLAGIDALRYPELLQCIGMLMGVYGLAYFAAGFDATRHWPVVLAGLAGKVLGPAGFAWGAWHGRLSWNLGWIFLVNDLLWWGPFGAILWQAYTDSLDGRRIASPEIQRMALRARTQVGTSLLDLSKESPVLLVFLRHFGCTFCREALADLAAQRRAIEALGVRIALVHMSSEASADRFFTRYGLADIDRVSDPNQNLYRAFGLARGRLGQLFGPKAWIRGFQAGILRRHGVGLLQGDGFQMPGVFLVFHGEVISSYRHVSAADRPDYLAMAQGETGSLFPTRRPMR
jgi:peroxiredoxin